MVGGLLAGPGVRALVVGTARHVAGSIYPGLPTVPATVEAIADRLVRVCGLDPANLRVLLDPADPRELGRALTVAAREAADVLYVHYVGHGLLADDGELHLATQASRDLDDDIATYQALPYAELRGVLERSRARLAVIVLDCCYAGRAPHLIDHRAEDDFEATRRHGVHLLAAARGDQLAWAPPDRKFTAFTGELIALLDHGDPAGPRELGLDDVYRYLSRRLPARGLPAPVRMSTYAAPGAALAVNPAYRPVTVAGPPGVAGDDRPSPYRGLSAFEPEDAALFFGRGTLTAELVDRVTRDPGPLIVTGPSGAGKSSLLRAGLLPGLRAAGDPGVHRVLTPGTEPLLELARRMAALSGVAAPDLRERWLADPAAFARDHGGVTIVVDQFEELFTQAGDARERDAFIAALTRPGPRVVLGVRADFFGHCTGHPALLPALRTPVVVGPMTAEGLREVIERPAADAGIGLEPGLADLLLHDLSAGAADAAGALPLLSHALLATWQRRENTTMTIAGYRAAGGVTRALTNTAEATLGALTPAEQDVARDLLLRLVRLGDETGDTRRAAAPAEVLPDPNDQPRAAAAATVVDRFVAARLLTAGQDRIAITHEALIRAWPRLRTWIDEDRTALLTRQQLALDAAAWADHDRDPSYLYTAGRLAAAATALGTARTAAELGPTGAEFLTQSRRRDRRRARRSRQVIAALGTLLLVTAGAGTAALAQQRVAERQRDDAIARGLAGASTTDVQDSTVAGRLSLAAYRLAANPESRGAVLAAATRPQSTRLIAHRNYVTRLAYDRSGTMLATNAADGSTRLWDVTAGTPVLRGEMAGTGIGNPAFRPDGRVLATASGGAQARLWDISDPAAPRPLSVLDPAGTPLPPAKDIPYAADTAFSRDGRLLATAAGRPDNLAILWDVSDPARPVRAATLRGHTHEVRAVAFSPAADLLATASRDGTLRLWDVRDPARPTTTATVAGHRDLTIGQVSFDATGTRIAAACVDGTTRILDIADPRRPRQIASLNNGSGFVYSATFSPDGRSVAATSFDDQAVRVWDITRPDRPVVAAWLEGPSDTVFRVAFSPDGRTVAAGSADRTVRFWRLDAPSARATLIGHTGYLSAVAVDARRGLLATGGGDNAARLWDVHDPAVPRLLAVVTGHTDKVRAVAFSPDGRRLVTASQDSHARLWDVADPAAPRLLGVADGPNRQALSAAAFTPDGSRVVTASFDRTAQLWAGTNTLAATFGGQQDILHGLAVAPDGTVVLTSADGTAEVWTTAAPDPAKLAVLTGHTAGVRAAAFAPGGKLLATGSADNTVRLWDLTDRAHPREAATLHGHTGAVSALAFSADGVTLASGAEDRTLRVWDLTDPAAPEPAAVIDARSAVNGVAFLPGGRHLVTAAGSAARFWPLDVDQAAAVICAPGGDGMTIDEWAALAPDLPAHDPCDQ
jgi:WD40 repeat protein